MRVAISFRFNFDFNSTFFGFIFVLRRARKEGVGDAGARIELMEGFEELFDGIKSIVEKSISNE